MPWRRTRDPYLIWISEIMLQQTRVAAVLEHYARFTERFPTVQTLAAASEADVLAMWSGLGYYRRARMMHKAAQVVAAQFGGVFPRAAEALLELPGIGAYTAAAVASIAFDEPVAVVDGNVERVLARVAAIGDMTRVGGSAESQVAAETQVSKARPGAPNSRGTRISPSISDARPGAPNSPGTRISPSISDARPGAPASSQIRTLAGELLDAGNSSHFNQGMMELGATICLPKGPLCLHCPVQPVCLTRGEHVVAARKPLTPRDAFYGLMERGEDVLLEQRAADASLMAGMWQLPELVGAPSDAELLFTVKHSITVTNYTVRVYGVDEGSAEWKWGEWDRRWCPLAKVGELPLTGLARKVLRYWAYEGNASRATGVDEGQD